MLTVTDVSDLLLTRRTGFHHHSQEDAGAAIGVKQRAISDWESGKALPSPRYYKKLAQYLGRPEREIAAAVDAERAARARRRNADTIAEVADRVTSLEDSYAALREAHAEFRGAQGANRELLEQLLSELRQR